MGKVKKPSCIIDKGKTQSDKAIDTGGNYGVKKELYQHNYIEKRESCQRDELANRRVLSNFAPLLLKTLQPYKKIFRFLMLLLH